MRVLAFIMQYYAWLIGAIIVTILAIIGYYADKTNFGQGKKGESQEQDKEIINNSNIQNVSFVENNIETFPANNEADTLVAENLQTAVGNEDININVENIDNKEIIDNDINDDQDLISYNIVEKTNLPSDEKNFSEINEEHKGTKVDSQNTTKQEVNASKKEEEFSKFEEEFNALLPKKELIVDDLLSDIDDLELGKTQKIDLTDVPDLDDIDLPKIKQFKEEEDIWKF